MTDGIQGLWVIPPTSVKQWQVELRRSSRRARDILAYIVPLSAQAIEIVRYLLERVKPAQRYLLPQRAAAITALKSDVSFDLVVTDLNMPDVKGVSVFQAAREVDENMPLVYVSDNIPDELAAMVRADPRAAAVGKPFSIDQLSDAIRTAMRTNAS